MSANPRAVAPPAPRLLAATLLTAVVVAALAGGLLAGRLLLGSPPPVDLVEPGPAPLGVGQSVKTSFGVVAVEHAEKLNGLTSKELGGMTHGVQSFVGSDKLQLQVTATITNQLDHPVAYSPGQFRLVAGKKKLKAAGSSITAGTLQPDAAIDARLSFVAPRDGGRLLVQFTDPGRSQPILIDLGKVDRAAPTDSHDHR
jgi:hypothetical protein